MKFFKKKVEVPMKKEQWGVWLSAKAYDSKNVYQRSWPPQWGFNSFDEAADWLIQEIGTKELYFFDFFFDWQTDHYAVLRDASLRPLGYYSEVPDHEATFKVMHPSGAYVATATVERYEV